MNPLWLCLIIPCSIWLGSALCVLLTMDQGNGEAYIALFSDARRLRECLRNLTDGTGDGYSPHIEAGKKAVIATGYLEEVRHDRV